MANDSSILLNCSKEFKDAVGKYANEHDMDVAPFIRKCVADVIGYNLSGDQVTRGRKRIYGSKEEAEQARKDRRITERALMEMFKHNEHVRTVLALRESLERKGVSPE